MKHISRALLWFLTIAIPVVISACYGIYFRFQKRGRVVDAQTREGISQIQVTCVPPGASDMAVSDLSDVQGGFTLLGNDPCASVMLEDTLVEPDGGVATDAGTGDPGLRTARYKDKSIPYVDPGAEDLVVDMERL